MHGICCIVVGPARPETAAGWYILIAAALFKQRNRASLTASSLPDS
jgi:hypothetical protein